MPLVVIRWREWSFMACTVDDYGVEHEHKRGITRTHALNRLVRSWF